MTTLDRSSIRAASRVSGWSKALRGGPSAVGRSAAVVGALAMVVSWLGSWNPSFWGDEAATVLSADRPLAVLVAELRHVDAVHGLYYLGMHFWIALFGTSELSARAPSAIAVGALVAGTVVLGARLAGLRYGILAGVVCAVLPRTTYLATEARSYAIGTAIAVWVTVFFVGLLRRRETRLLPWLALGALVGLAGYLFLYLVLLGVVYAAVIITSRQNRVHLSRFLRAAAVTSVVVSPVALLAYSERGQVAFLAVRGYATPGNVLGSQWFGDTAVGGVLIVPVLGWLLMLIAVITVVLRTARGDRDAVLENRDSDRDVVRLGVAWVVIPTALLLVGNVVSPMYNIRYLSFSTPGVALLVAVGALAVGRLAVPAARRMRGMRGMLRPLSARSITAGVAGTVLVVFGVAAIPGYVAQRGDFAKNGGSDWRQVADYVQGHATEGDAVIFDPTPKPSQRPELAYRLYPQQFAAVTAVEIATPYYTRASLWDAMTPLAGVRSELAQSPTVWALEFPVGHEVPEDIVDLTAHGYRVVSSQLVHRVVVYQLQKGTS